MLPSLSDCLPDVLQEAVQVLFPKLAPLPEILQILLLDFIIEHALFYRIRQENLH